MVKLSRSDIGLVLGPVCFLFLLVIPPPAGMPPQALHTAAVAVLMAIWWISEALPVPVTALLPILLFPVLGVVDGAKVTHSYAHHLIYLFLGGFLIAVTVEKWNLHRRIALYAIRLVGFTADRIILGFMLATAFLSMWISNTAAAMMMVTIGLAVLRRIGDPAAAADAGPSRFGTALMLGIAYSASIGGVATLIGTPPNAIFVGVVEKTFGHSIDFTDWIAFGLPLSACMLVVTWIYLTKIAFRSGIDQLPGSRETIRLEIAQLGPMSRQEKRVLTVFSLVALLWILRGLVTIPALAMVEDSTIAMGGALLLFIIPADFSKREFLLDWKTALTIPWDVLILFGGGFALAQAFSETGLTSFLAERLSALQGMNVLIIILAVTAFVIFLTEVTSNTATASITLPVMAALAEAVGVHPYGVMVAAALAASFAFMLPVATPPNAIVYGSHYVSIPQMAKAGVWLNIIGIVIISLFVFVLLPLVWHIKITAFPADFIPVK